MMSLNQLEGQNLYQSDPLAYLLSKKLKLSSFTSGFWSIAIGSGLLILSAWLSNTLWSAPGQIGLLQDWIPWVAVILINPVVLGYYLWSFKAINHTIEELELSDVVEINRTEIGEITSTFYYKKWRNFLALGSAVGFSIFVFVTQPKLGKSWASSGLLPNLSITIATLVIVYVGSMLVLNLITNIRIFNNIFKQKKLNVNPLHPDRCGGLRSLSNYSLTTAYLIAVLGVWIGIVAYQFITQNVGRDYWYIVLVVLLYISLSIACFFGPLLTAHRGMSRAKEALLHKIAQQFQTDYIQIQDSLNEDAETLKKRAEKIQELRAFYTTTDDFPVWPFDVKIFRRYLLTVPTPLLVPFLGLLQKIVGILLKKWGINF